MDRQMQPLSARAESPAPSTIKQGVLDGPQMLPMPQHSPFSAGQRVWQKNGVGRWDERVSVCQVTSRRSWRILG